MNVGTFLFMITCGLRMGASMCIGNCIGAGNVIEAKEYMKISN